MLELYPTDAAIIACSADPAALAGIASPPNTFAARVAPDELWWIGPLGDRDRLLGRARAALASTDALVLDQSDAWDIWTVRGPLHRTVLQRLMLAPIPAERPGFVQGTITGVPSKVITVADGAHLFVPGPVGHHLRDRILSVMADRPPTRTAARPFAVEELVAC